MNWLEARWPRWRQRRRNFKEFRQTGAFDVKRQSDASNYGAEKLADARDWLYRRDTIYQRLAFGVSVIAISLSGGSLIVSYTSAENARKAERAWLGPLSMRLDTKAGQRLNFMLEYQNTGRQPAQDVSYVVDSYSYNKDMQPDIAARSDRFLAKCKATKPGDDRLTLFPGKGRFEAYSVPGTFITTAMRDGTDVAFLDGCFVYRTLGEVHRTAFCFKYGESNSEADDHSLSLCNHGHYAD